AFARDAERAGGGGLVVPVLSKRLDEDVLLELVHHLFERALLGGCAIDDVVDLTDARRKEIGRRERAGIDLDDDALHFVLELAHVARPVVRLEELHGLRGDPRDRFADLVGITLEEDPAEKRDVFAALSERGDAERKDSEAVVQILAEALLFDLFLE